MENELALVTLDLHYNGSDASVRGPNPSSIEGEWLQGQWGRTPLATDANLIPKLSMQELVLSLCLFGFAFFDSRKPLCLTEAVTPSQGPWIDSDQSPEPHPRPLGSLLSSLRQHLWCSIKGRFATALPPVVALPNHME